MAGENDQDAEVVNAVFDRLCAERGEYRAKALFEAAMSPKRARKKREATEDWMRDQLERMGVDHKKIPGLVAKAAASPETEDYYVKEKEGSGEVERQEAIERRLRRRWQGDKNKN